MHAEIALLLIGQFWFLHCKKGGTFILLLFTYRTVKGIYPDYLGANVPAIRTNFGKKMPFISKLLPFGTIWTANCMIQFGFKTLYKLIVINFCKINNYYVKEKINKQPFHCVITN